MHADAERHDGLEGRRQIRLLKNHRRIDTAEDKEEQTTHEACEDVPQIAVDESQAAKRWDPMLLMRGQGGQ